MSNVTLVTGGARSGKSSFAMQRALTYADRAFIATAIPFDDEMNSRIAKHREERADRFTTIEEPVKLASAIESIPDNCEVAIIDCLTVWLGNLIYDENVDAESETEHLLTAIEASACDLIIVSNEVGMGIVPDNGLARKFRDMAGMLNQKVAAAADNVVLVASGIPVFIKGGSQ